MNRACRRLPCSAAAAAALLLGAAAANAQLEINSTPNPVGSGARALGMGAAFIAVADDATAASWNPAGLTQLERPEISIVYSSKFLSEEFSSGPFPELGGRNSVDIHDLNYLSFVYPVPRTIAGRNLVFSINYLSQYDFDRSLQLRQRQINPLASGNLLSLRRSVDYLQEGKLASVSPAFGFEISEWMAVGTTVNLWHSALIPNNGWEIRQKETQAPFWVDGTPVGTQRTRFLREEKYDDFKGVNATVGLLFKPTERLSVGAVYHSKLVADVEYTSKTTIRPLALGVARDKRDKRITLPSAVGLGVAYRFPGDKLTISFDVTRRAWDEFVIRDPQNINRNLRRVSGVTGQPKSLAASNSATWTVRLGGEYVFVNEKKPVQDYLPSLRAGIFYDPEPSGGRDRGGFFRGNSLAGTRGDGSVDDYFGFSLGGGVLIKNRVNLDAAYIFRWGHGVRNDTFGFANTNADVRQHYLYLSTVVYF